MGIRNITEDLLYVGASDRRLALFENVYPIPAGVSYNAYLLMDQQTVLMDTVDKSVSDAFYANVKQALNGRTLDFVVVQHMEPDHCASLAGILLRYPEVVVVCNKKTVTMMQQYFPDLVQSDRLYVVNEGDTLTVGTHTLTFVMAPMVHWPEVMVTYDSVSGTLFSADAFGGFGAINGNLYADEVDLAAGYIDEMRRYYINIVGKYGAQVQALLKKATGLDIRRICPLHGLIWRNEDGLQKIINKYDLWSRYVPEEQGVLIAYASVYGHTEEVANRLAGALADAGVHNIHMYDVSATHVSYVMADAFRFSHVVLASITYNAGIFVQMENLLHDLVAHNWQGRTLAFIENGTWAPVAGKQMRELVGGLKGMKILDASLTLKSSLAPGQEGQVDAMAAAIVADMHVTADAKDAKREKNVLNASAMYKLSYGLYLLSAAEKGKDNACIVNTVTQLTSAPMQVSVTVHKSNLTHDMIKSTGLFNVSVLSEKVPFEVLKQFGFQSGRDVDKFEGCTQVMRAENGVLYLNKYTNAYLSCRVISSVDCGTHTQFIAEVTAADVLSEDPSVTYTYYQEHIKPKAQPKPQAEEKKQGYVCKICGYVYEGETLPEDFICPLCKHGAEDFEKL